MLEQLFVVTTLLGQAAATAEQNRGTLSWVAQFYKDGGVWMHPIALVGVIALACVVERVVQIFFRYNINATAFMAQIHKLVMANNIDRAIKLCNGAPSALLPRVIKAGL